MQNKPLVAGDWPSARNWVDLELKKKKTPDTSLMFFLIGIM